MDDGARAASARRLIGLTLRVLIVAGAMLAGLYAYRLQFVQPRTDDAAVRANVVGIAPQVSGPIVDLRVVDNQHVNAGDLLFAVDCRPYEARLARTRADLALALKEVDAQRRAIASAGSEVGRREANLASATAQIARAEEERAAAEAAVARLQAEADYADDYLGRVEPLLKRQFVTADRVADARSRRDVSAAAVQEARRPPSSTPWPLAVMRRLPSTNHTTSARGPRTSWPRSAISTHAWKPPRRPCARPNSTWATARCAHPSTPT